MATVYVIATPIGNLEDISLRALRVLKEVNTVVCEDTRVTKRLLQKYEISTRVLSYHAQSDEHKEQEILEVLKNDNSIALVTDSGTPGISDPGSRLISLIKKELPEIKVVAIPGPSAFVAALSISGVPTDEFIFLGFLPHKKGRETLFKEIAGSDRTMVFYESPHRILKTLESLKLYVGEDKKVTVVREITKMFEEVLQGNPEEILSLLTSKKEKQKGEFVVIVSRYRF